MVYRSAGPSCPRCKRLLVELAVESGSALGCEQCGGVLIDDAGFAAVRERLYATILKRTGAPPDAPMFDPSTMLPCPRCGETMKRTWLANVPIDLCTAHGTWFDAHELVAVAQAIADKRGLAGAERAPPAELPWSGNRETAEQLARLKEQLQAQNNSLLITHALATLRRLRW